MTDLASLNVAMDTRQVQSGTKDLKALEEQAKQTASAVGGLEGAAVNAGAAAEEGAKGHKRATDAINEATEGYKLNRMQLMELMGVARHSFDQLASGGSIFRTLAVHAGTLAQTLAEGQGGLAGGLAAVSRLLVNPITLGLAFAAALVAIEEAGAKANERMQELAALANGVGALAGQTAQSIKAAADVGAKANDDSKKAAEDQAITYLKVAGVSAEVLQGMIAHTKDFAAVTGDTAKEAVKDFANAMADPTKGAEELNAKLNFLTDTQLKNIEALQQSGDKLGAQKALMDALTPVLDDQRVKLQGLAAVWHEVADGIRDAMKGLGEFLNGDPASKVTQATVDALQHKRDVQASATGLSPLAQMLQQGRLDALDAQIKAARQELDRQAQSAASHSSTYAGGVNDALNPHLVQQRQYQNQLDGLKANLPNLSGKEYLDAAENIQKLTQATKDYMEPAQKAAKIQELDAQMVEARRNPALRASLAYQRSMIDTNGQLMTAEQREAIAQGEANKARAEANRFAERRAESFARQYAAQIANVEWTMKEAQAYLTSTAAGEHAEGVRKAEIEAKQKGVDASKVLQVQEDQEVASKLLNAAKTASTMQADADIRAKVNAEVAAGTLALSEAEDTIKAETAARDMHVAMVSKDINVLRIAETAYIDLLAAQKATRDAAAGTAMNNETQALDEQNELLKVQAQNLNATARERAVNLAIAQEAARQEKELAGSSTSADGIAMQMRKGATAGANFDVSTARDELQKYADTMTKVGLAGANAANAIGKAFGAHVGAIGGAMSALSSYSDKLAQIAAQRRADDKAGISDTEADAKAAEAQKSARLDAYASITEAGMTMFNKHTAAYKVLQAADMAFRAVQFAGSVAAMVQHAAETGSVVAKNLVQMGSNVATGASKMFSQLGVWGFAAVGAMVAVMAALGFSGGRGGGATYDVKAIQDGQESGTVLGDSGAKSTSIADSLKTAQADWNKDLEYSSQMVASLRSIDAAMGTLTASLARALQLPGGLGSPDLKNGFQANYLLGGPLAGLLGTGTKTTQTLLDQGLQFSPQSIAQIMQSGIQASVFDLIQTQKKSSFLGITYSNKTSTNDQLSNLDGSTKQDLTNVVLSLEQGVVAAASQIGVKGADDTMKAFQVALGQVSLKDLKGQALTDAINAIFSKLGDQMATYLVPAITDLQKAGEGAFETLTRVAREYQVVDVAMTSIGRTFGEVGLESIKARDALVQLFGSQQDFSNAVSGYTSSILTDAERLAIMQTSVTNAMSALGLANVTTKEQFKSVVDGLDLTTDAGRQMFEALMNIAPAFGKVADAAQSAQDTLDQAAQKAAADALQKKITDATTNASDAIQAANAAKSALESAYSAQVGLLDQVVNKYQALVDAINGYEDQLNTTDQGGMGILQQTQNAKSAFYADSNPTTAAAYLKLAQQTSGTSSEYALIVAQVREQLDTTKASDQAQIDVAHQQLAAMNAQLAGIVQLNTTAATLEQQVSDGFTTLAVALAAYQGAQSTVDKTAQAVQGVGGTIDVQKYLADNPDLTANWNAGGVMKTLGATLEEAAAAHYQRTGQYEIAAGLRHFATGGSFMVGGVGGVDSQTVAFQASPNERVQVTRPDQEVDTAAAIDGLRGEVANLTIAVAAVATYTQQTARIMTRAEVDGMPVRATDPTQPINVHTV